jgi:trimeric autotransporter adhesin
MRSRNITLGAILSAMVSFALCQQAQAQDTPDPGSVGPFNTADGDHALFSNTSGFGNSAFGWYALSVDTDASFNTAVGAGALDLNNGNNNTAVGGAALLLNTTGTDNTAVGVAALENNADGGENNAVGSFALFANASGFFNNAHGRNALTNNTNSENNAFGDLAMENNTTGASNTAIGDDALRFNEDGSGNVAVGDEAGTDLGVSVNNCIAINVPGAGPFAVLDNTCFIGSIFDQPVSDVGTQEAVFVDQFNVIGISASSRRFKHDIQPMDKASEAILALKPVSFKYNADKNGRTQYGLIAEEVTQVNPDLVVSRNGEVSTVRYEQVNAMLLNEFLKEHKKVEEQQASIGQLKSEMQTMVAELKEQAAQIQKVSAQVEMAKPATKVAVGNQ